MIAFILIILLVGLVYLAEAAPEYDRTHPEEFIVPPYAQREDPSQRKEREEYIANKIATASTPHWMVTGASKIVSIFVR